MSTYPLVLLSHRKSQFINRAIGSIRQHLRNVGEIVVVDDSGDEEHYGWLADNTGLSYSVVKYGQNAGYRDAMIRVFEVAEEMTDRAGVEYAMLWEEDFLLQRAVNLGDMARIMDANPVLAQLNLQRQAVYGVERRFGYMESHMRRGYGLSIRETDGIPWVYRERPFTTNPGMIRRPVLSRPWPSRETCDGVDGGAEPAMSLALEADGWRFGWYGAWNRRQTLHIGAERKTGAGY